MAAVSQWRFNPARQHGTPVAVQINVEVNFRLPNKPNMRKLTERANAGDPKAKVKLAMAYFLGHYVPKDPTLGLEWTRKAADQGLSLAQSLLCRIDPLPALSPSSAITSTGLYNRF
jgi:TPR repeat protein